MSTTGKIVLWVVIVIVIIGGIWWWIASQGSGQSSGTSSPAPAVNATGTVGTNGTTTASSSLPQGDSNQSINQEMASINAQMNGLSSDTANVNQSMNDQPVQQAE